jgi:hypothetical protein
MSEPVIVTLFPKWRQAVQDFLQEFQYGALVGHDWLAERFGIPGMEDHAKLTSEEFSSRQFEWLASIEAFKAELLQDHQVCLQSVRGKGYRWVPPHEQTGFAEKEFQRDAVRVFRTAGQRLKNVRLDELTDRQRRENVDAAAKISALHGMTRKALR